MTVMWVAESGARLEGIINDETKQENDQLAISENTSLVPTERPEVDATKYEVIDLVSYYLGPKQKILYQISLMSLMYAHTKDFVSDFTHVTHVCRLVSLHASLLRIYRDTYLGTW
eukprot:CAMPEP_0202510466 /NCGR_PEP_ID=MMETSP1361-20130828/53308_1 /ASSEMBLY_ACC=CAM_ASM_000849 /TAXON_ID=210615 /ORGANISM="Staurosira complex sp., Strain CCMP2646" /LENGTH=114 /DNA_ID=CAMNT_0049144731 /DNA_START=235 /DNA_END=576 /DNA_ORIENTATION=-